MATAIKKNFMKKARLNPAQETSKATTSGSRREMLISTLMMELRDVGSLKLMVALRDRTH
ncbi:hypothetical protein ACVWZK_007194 [Bradyrhizobium sp. GM0.4]